MKIISKLMVFMLILMCPLMGACALDPTNTRDSKYGVITIRPDNAQNYFSIMAINYSVDADANAEKNKLKLNLTVGFPPKSNNVVIDEIKKKVKLNFVYKFKAVFKNTENKIVTKEWDDLELGVEFDVGCSETNGVICADIEIIFALPQLVQIYNSSEFRIKYYKTAEGKIFIPRPPETSGAVS